MFWYPVVVAAIARPTIRLTRLAFDLAGKASIQHDTDVVCVFRRCPISQRSRWSLFGTQDAWRSSFLSVRPLRYLVIMNICMLKPPSLTPRSDYQPKWQSFAPPFGRIFNRR